jgi:hypothetical protein
MVAIKVLALAIVAFSSTSWAEDCPGVKMSDGTCIVDPSLTTQATQAPVQTVAPTTSTSTPYTGVQPNYAPDRFEVEAIKEFCQSSSNPSSCMAGKFAELNARDAAIIKAAKDKAASEQAAAAPPAAPPAGGGGGGGNEDKGGEQQAEPEQASNEGQPEDSSGGGEEENQNNVGKAHGGECVAKVIELAKVCSKKKEEAAKACDDKQDEGVKSAIAAGDRRGKELMSKQASTRDATIFGAVDNAETAGAYKQFGASCKEKHVACESECDSVRKTYDALCLSDRQKQAQVAPKVQQSESDRLVCRDEYGQTAKNAAAQSSGSQGSGEEAAGETKQSASSGSGEGMDHSQMMQQFAQAAKAKDEKKAAEKAAEEQAMAQIRAGAKAEVVCASNSAYAALEVCKCATGSPLCGVGGSPIRGLSSDAPAVLTKPGY